jgi:hypothetical protein
MTTNDHEIVVKLRLDTTEVLKGFDEAIDRLRGVLADQIIKELAASDPVLDVGGIEDDEFVCVHCAAGLDSNGFKRIFDEVGIRNDHRSNCLWVRANKLVNG